MAEYKEKEKVGFEEALRMIADTPKSAIVDKHKKVDIFEDNNYTAGKEAAKKPPRPTKSRA